MNRRSALGLSVGVAALLAAVLLATPAGGAVREPVTDVFQPSAAGSPASPGPINFQGILKDATGQNAVPDGTYSVRFSVWDAATEGTEKWNETQSVMTADGLFSVLLGSSTALSPSVFAGAPLFLEIQVGTDPAMTPRQQFGAVPYALTAVNGQGLNVRAYGAKGDGTTDDTKAIMAAINDLPVEGGVVFFPPGVYLTTGINIVDKKVSLVGSGGACDTPAPNLQRLPFNCATVIRSTENAPIIKFTTADPVAGLFSNRFWVGLRDLAVQGNGCGFQDPGIPPDPRDACIPENTAMFNSQHCLQVDNRGLEAYDITLIHCGGHGLYLSDSVISNFYNMKVAFANGDGINADNNSTSAQAGSANGTNFFGGGAFGNGRDGIRIVRGGWGTSTFGFTFESNHDYGINLEGDPSAPGGEGVVRFSRFMSTWDELNGLGSVHFTSQAQDNLVDFVRYSKPPVFDAPHNRNLVWGSSLSARYTGTSTAVSATTMTDENANWTTDALVGNSVHLADSSALITANTSNTLTFSAGWSGGIPENGPYEIQDQFIKHQFQTIVTGGAGFSAGADRLRIQRLNGDPGDVLGGVFQGIAFTASDRFTLFPGSSAGTLFLWDLDRLSTGGSVANIEAQDTRTLQLNAPQIMLGTGGYERLRVDASGNVGIGTTAPQSALQVGGGYIQFPTVSGAAPPAGDCDSAAEAGRMVVRTDGPPHLYICTGTAWVGM